MMARESARPGARPKPPSKRHPEQQEREERMLRDRLTGWATPRRVDVVVAAGLVLWALPQLRSWWQPDGQHTVGGWLGTIAFAVAQGAPFLLRRRLPLLLL